MARCRLSGGTHTLLTAEEPTALRVHALSALVTPNAKSRPDSTGQVVMKSLL